jgi:hypothetical protein
MDIIEKIKTAREKDIAENKMLNTANHIFVVFDVRYSFTEHSSPYEQSSSVFGYADEFFRCSNEGETIEAEDNTSTWDDTIEINGTTYNSVCRVGYHDKFVTVCFTKEAADKFIESERHNLKTPRIYVEHIPRRNRELRELCKLFGDK